MKPKFGKLTLDELKEVYETCAKDPMCCDKECRLYDFRKVGPCINVLQESVLELINSYKTTLTLCEHWFKRADVLSDKAGKYDSVRNELIRTQEVVKNLQDECRERADKIKNLRDTIDTMDDDYNELNAKLNNAEMVRKRLEIENEDLKDKMEYRKNVIDQLMKEKDETNAALLHYHALKNSLKVIGEAMRGDQSGDHEKD